MDELTERQKMILMLEAIRQDVDRACHMIENGSREKTHKAIGLLHSILSRVDYKSKELLMQEADEAALRQEQANAEAVFRA
jgi:hypothetical protein